MIFKWLPPFSHNFKLDEQGQSGPSEAIDPSKELFKNRRTIGLVLVQVKSCCVVI